MKKNIKTLLCLLLGAVLLIGLLAGCGGDKDEAPASNDPQIVAPTTGGMLLLNVNAAVEIIYDTDSFVMSIKGADANGKELVAAQDDMVGMDITDAVQALTKAALTDGYLIKGEKVIVIKQSLGSASPGTAFLENILVDIQTVSEGFPIFIVNEDMLDEMGYITVDACKELLAAALLMDEFEEIECNPEAENGRYVMHLPIDGRTEYFTVDYNLGTVRAAELSEYDEDAMNGVESEDVIYNPNEEQPGDNEPFPEDTEPQDSEDIVIDLEEEISAT